MKILMLGTYDLNEYSRGRILYKGLLKNNVKVSLFLPKGKLKYFKLARRLLKKDYNIILVNGKLNLILCKILKPFHRRPIVFDVFISDYDSLVKDRKLVKENSFKARILWLLDKYTCKWADFVILDTKAHIKYFVKEFGLKTSKFKEIYIGADEEIFRPTSYQNKKNKKFIVLFHGTFIPLQGIEYIVKAAKLLEKDREILFQIIGYGQTFKKIKKLVARLKIKNIHFLGFQEISKIPTYISKADVCLGIFGETQKAKRVIPNKAFEVIAMKKPLITADTPAIKELFIHRKNCYLCKISDEKSLAVAIKELKNDFNLRKKIALNGYKLFKEKCTSKEIGNRLKKLLKSIALSTS